STLVRDFEMSQSDVVEPNPWQTDACIGAWHYSRGLYENHRYRTPQSIIHLLIDVVSKNGNLLLNIPLPGHGRPDDDEFAFLAKFTAWMTINSEAIYSTRPWKVYGEGPTKGSGSLYGGRGAQFAASDIRFTTKGDSLYAIAMAWPEDGRLTIRSLATNSPHYGGAIARIGLLGSETNLVWSRSPEGVTVNLPEKPPCDYAYVIKINPLGA
ncbi:MAG TPA: alpha-L-fucosidase, partial [Bryobacteraceae bacterium]|nr:alpha-L-fucosidase [Bryobacteraceae bacterium]